jgi:hypothetical protein
MDGWCALRLGLRSMRLARLIACVPFVANFVGNFVETPDYRSTKFPTKGG